MKLENFEAVYMNIGPPNCAKELVGVRRNTKFIGKNSKSKGRALEDQTNFLVVSFENRKSPTSPFVEFPINRLGVMMHALEDLKQHAIQQGLYNSNQDSAIIKHTYKDGTTIGPKMSKNNSLPLD